MKVKSTHIPPGSALNSYLPANYQDSFVCSVKLKEGITPDDILIAFFTQMPQWIDFLFKLRNLLVKPFGLKGGNENMTQDFTDCVKNGGSSGILSVTEKLENETIILLSDTHLNAHISAYIEKNESDNQFVYLSTIVHYHNLMGRLYFGVIAPFHDLVVKYMMGHMMAKMENKQ